MKLNFITIMVRDMEKTIAFYGEMVGLKEVRRFNPGLGEIVFMANDEGETMLEFIQFDNTEKVAAKGMVMSFSAGDNLEQLEKLREKAVQLGYNPTEIISQGPKPAYFTVLDPDGLVVEFS